MLITKCTTQDEDKNAINDKYIVSVARMLADYFLCSYYTLFSLFLEGQSLPLKIKPVRSFIHLFCYLLHDCIEQLPKVGADMSTKDDNNRLEYYM